MAEVQCGEIQLLLDSHLKTAQDLCSRCDKQLHIRGELFFLCTRRIYKMTWTRLITVLHVYLNVCRYTQAAEEM